MADDLASRVTATTMPKYMKDFQDGISKKAVEFYWAQKNDLFTFNQGGSEIQWRIRTAQGTPWGYTGAAEGATFAVRNDYTIATAPWRGIANGFVITQQEDWQCKGREQIIALVPTLMADMKYDLLDEFGTSFYSDGTRLSSKTFHGLAASISTTATYAGISQSTTTAWAAQSVDGTGYGSDPLAKLLSLQMACSKGNRGGRDRNQVDIFLGDSTDYQVAMNSLAAKQIYTTDTEMAKAGFANAMCWGVPFAWSEYATAATIFALNSNLFEIVCGTSQLFETFTEWTVGFPKLYLAAAVSHFNMLNKNPRGSGKLTSTTS